MKTNKNICIFALIMLLGTYNNVMAQDLTDENNYSDYIIQSEVFEDSIKANKGTLEKAQEAINNKDFNTAITYMNSYITSKPKKYEGYKLRGDAYYALRRYDLAQSDYQTAVNIKSADDKLMTSTKYVSAVILGADKNEQLQNTELGNLYARLMYAQKALNNPEYTTSYENAVKYNSHIYLPQPKKSDISQINCPQKYGKELNPQGIDASIYGAITDIENKKFNDALYKLQNVTSSYPDYYLGHYLYGVSLVGLDSDNEAITAFEKALSLNSNDFESMASLGQIYYNRAETTFSASDAQKSIHYFQKALKYNPNNNIYYMYIGLNQLQAGNNSQAISAFDKALKINENDYNSLYYKSIAQYLNGDYQGTINNTTSLLRKHVSNYNSVLYLRAQAYNKLGSTDKALADLDEIQSNIEDIYNADIKVVSDKEKTLGSYVYYLKAQMQHAQGLGAASDMDKALQNPIIAQLSKAETAITPYEDALEKETLTKEDYDKFESFYKTSLPKMLQSGVVITEDDINNQYDYIRTTFSDLGITFNYTNPDYKMTTIADYPYKKYASKLPQSELSTIEQNIVPQLRPLSAHTTSSTMRESTPQSELLLRGQNGSLAQLLATNALALQSIPKAESNESNITSTEDIAEAPIVPEIKPDTPAAENVKSNNISSGEPIILTDKANLINDENAKNVKEILDVEKSIENNIQNSQEPYKISAKEIKESTTFDIKTAKSENETPKTATEALNYISNGYVLTAKEIKETPDITIKSEKPDFIKKVETPISEIQTASNGSIIFSAPEKKETEDIVIKYHEEATAQIKDNIQNATKNIEQKTEDLAQPVNSEVKIASKTIKTKYAEVNPEDFGIQTKQTPTITEFDEVIELDKGSLMFDLEGDKNYAKNLEAEINKRLEEQQINYAKAFSDDMTNAVTLPEEEVKTIVSNTTETKAATTPAVIVPELQTKAKDNIETSANITADTTEQISLQEKTLAQGIKDVDTRAYDYNNIKYSPVITQNTEHSNVFSNSAEKTEKELKAEAKALEKAQKEQAKQLAKEQKQQLKEEAKLKATIAKEQAEESVEVVVITKEQAKALKEAQKAERAEEKARIASEKAEAKALEKAKKDADRAAKNAQNLQLKQERAIAKEEAKAAMAEKKQASKTEAQLQAEQLRAERKEAKAQAKIQKAETKAIAKAQKEKIRQARAQAKAQAREEAMLQKETLKTERAKAQAQADVRKTEEKEAQKVKNEIIRTQKAQIAAEEKQKQIKAEKNISNVQKKQEKNVSNTTKTKNKFNWKNLFPRKKNK